MPDVAGNKSLTLPPVDEDEEADVDEDGEEKSSENDDEDCCWFCIMNEARNDPLVNDMAVVDEPLDEDNEAEPKSPPPPPPPPPTPPGPLHPLMLSFTADDEPVRNEAPLPPPLLLPTPPITRPDVVDDADPVGPVFRIAIVGDKVAIGGDIIYLYLYFLNVYVITTTKNILVKELCVLLLSLFALKLRCDFFSLS